MCDSMHDTHKLDGPIMVLEKGVQVRSLYPNPNPASRQVVQSAIDHDDKFILRAVLASSCIDEHDRL
jgi:hypothetical protein